MTIFTRSFSSTYLPLFCALSLSSVFARHCSTRISFTPRKLPTTRLSSLSPASPPLSELGASRILSERDDHILAAYAYSLVAAATMSRGGYQNDNDDNDYYDDRGYYGSNDDFYYSKPYGDEGNYEDNYPYDDRGSSYDDRGKGSRFGSPSFSMPDIIRTGNRKIGLPLLAIGGALTILGASLFFNKTLMRLGNLFFVAGVPMTIGPGRTAGYFFQPKKARATACLAAGVTMVFIGWPILGIILEAFGLLNLFGNMFPIALMFLKQMPVIGPLLKGDSGRKKNNSGRHNDPYDDYDRYQDDRYYNDRGYPNDDDDNRYY